MTREMHQFESGPWEGQSTPLTDDDTGNGRIDVVDQDSDGHRGTYVRRGDSPTSRRWEAGND